jgi:uncharacterized membrane protein
MAQAIYKALTWRLVATAEIFVISFLTTGTLKTAGSIAGIVAFTSTALYVVHEKVWHHHDHSREHDHRQPQACADA